MNLAAVLKNIAKKSTFLRVFMRNTMYFARKILYVFRGLNVKTDEKMLVFGAYNGRSYACSPKAIYEYMIEDERFRDYKFIWFFDHPENYRFLEKNRNTKVVKSQSAECEKYLHRAKYWILNFRAVDQWLPKKDQIYVQCWHGTPLKRLGYDITNSDNAMNSVKEIQSKYRTDAKRFRYMMSPCKFVTEKFTSAWNLEKYGKEDTILEIGYPRNDFLKKYTEKDVAKIKQALNLGNTDKKIILYAPTWRDNQHDASKGYVYKSPVDFAYLKEKLGEEYIILFRAHYLVADSFDFDAYKGFIYDVSKYDDINELYITADILITDYSSVFFDYAILERPMLFYMYDMEEYRDEMRGFYIDVESLPGPIVKTEDELICAITVLDTQKCDMDMIRKFNCEYNSRNDGEAAKRLVDIIMKK